MLDLYETCFNHGSPSFFSLKAAFVFKVELSQVLT